MKNLRVLCWAWIVAATLATLLHAPVSVTHRHHRFSGGSEDTLVTTTEWIGPFGSPSRDFVGTYGSIELVKSSIDFPRLIVAILAVNLLPAVLLWRHDEVVG
jgi:hemolysin-activating ACP:hemolysin acyltransferase